MVKSNSGFTTPSCGGPGRHNHVSAISQARKSSPTVDGQSSKELADGAIRSPGNSAGWYMADHGTVPCRQFRSIVTAIQHAAISVHEVDDQRLTELCGSRHHQGIAARMGEFPYSDESQLLRLLEEEKSGQPSLPSLIVVCDRIQDAFNFGAILRCCDGAAATAVVIGSEHQVGVTPHVARSSAGAVNHVQIARVENLADTAAKLSALQFRMVAATEKGDDLTTTSDLSGPTCLMIGSEAVGLSAPLLALADVQVRIPMRGSVGSLNAAVAAGILLYEIRRQHDG